jgi:hypothetical protein
MRLGFPGGLSGDPADLGYGLAQRPRVGRE